MRREETSGDQRRREETRGAYQRHALFLATAKIHALFANFRLVSPGQHAEVAVQHRQTHRLPILLCIIRLAEENVVL
jgi:hypothetical protein